MIIMHDYVPSNTTSEDKIHMNDLTICLPDLYFVARASLSQCMF